MAFRIQVGNKIQEFLRQSFSHDGAEEFGKFPGKKLARADFINRSCAE
jgi:hypothetical protein